MNYDQEDLASLAWKLRLENRRRYATRTTEEIAEDDDRVTAFFVRNQRGMTLGMQQAAEAEDAQQ